MQRHLVWLVSLVMLAGSPEASGQINVLPSDTRSGHAAPLCGIYSLAAAARSLGVDSSFPEILDGEFVSGKDGSTIADLCRAAERIGLVATPKKRGTVYSLKSSAGPRLLHLNRSKYQTVSRHWVVYLGDVGGFARILDPPGQIELRSYADLLAEWDGVMVEINKEKKASVNFDKLVFQLCCISAFFLGVVGLRRLEFYLHPVGQTWRQLLRNIMLLIVACFVVANVLDRFLRNSFGNNPSSVALVTQYHFATNLPRVE